jgi:hypothetical protein
VSCCGSAAACHPECCSGVASGSSVQPAAQN